MFWHLLITPVVLLFNSTFNALPPWTITIGRGFFDGASTDSSIDHSMLHYSLYFLRPFDKYVPLHDAVLPMTALALAFFVSLLGFKLFKFVLSLVPTISAGG